MQVKILSDTKNELELEIDGVETSIIEIVVSKLNEDKNVEFAAYSWLHPLEDKQKLYFRTIKGKPKEILKKSLTTSLSELKELRGQLLK